MRLTKRDVVYAAVLILWAAFMVYLYVTNPFGNCDVYPDCL